MVDKLFISAKAVINHNGKILLLRESTEYKDGTNAGRYEFPGGRLDLGESVRECLARELNEEIGLEATIGEPFFVNEWYPKVRGENWQIVGIFYNCTLKSGQIKLSEEHSEYIWIDPSEYKKYDVMDSLLPVFEHMNNKS
jgi:8-oxo-dGTP diphosphatase